MRELVVYLRVIVLYFCLFPNPRWYLELLLCLSMHMFIPSYFLSPANFWRNAKACFVCNTCGQLVFPLVDLLHVGSLWWKNNNNKSSTYMTVFVWLLVSYWVDDSLDIYSRSLTLWSYLKQIVLKHLSITVIDN